MNETSATLRFVVSDFLAATCSVLSVGKEALIVDPGLRVLDEVRGILDQHHLAPVAVLVSHGHLDHVADASHVAREFSVPVYVGARDEYRMDNPIEQLPSAFTQQIAVMWREHGWSKPDPTRPLEHGDTIRCGGIDVVAHAYPGHTEGSTVYVADVPTSVEPRVGVTPVALSAPGVVFTGDVLFAGTIGRTDLPGGNADDMEASLAGLRAFALENPDLVMVPGHGPVSTLGAQLGSNPFLSLRA